jgi:hypothetical protein
VTGDVVIEHHHPQAGTFVREHGPDAVAVLEDLLCRAEVVDGALVVQASSRDVAGRLGFLSKDSANRRIRQLQRAGVLRVAPGPAPRFAAPRFAAPTYVVRLAGTGIAVSRLTTHRTRTATTATRSSVSELPTLFTLPDARS